MKIKFLFGQVSENYPGEHAPELILAIDEWVLESNPEHWDAELKRVSSDGYMDNF
jgi:hypothetical protein